MLRATDTGAAGYAANGTIGSIGIDSLWSIDDLDRRSVFCLLLLPVTLGIARPATRLELVTTIDLVPTVGRPLISVALPHRATADPHMPIPLPGPVSRCPRITTAHLGNDFDPRWWRSYLDNNTACQRRSG